ncbi:MAG: hypothetical protein IKU43_00360 [Clostridia bacterium]|nr:hypothetical protein [Clostridia bacterium]
MASKWKYADMDYRQRLGLIEKGNKDVFDEEIARTKEIVKARRELGLDTAAQEKWIDEVGYNYAKFTAGEGDKISESGYAKLYLEDKPKDTEPSPVKSYREKGFDGTAYISGAKSKIKKAGELAKSSAMEKSEEAKRKAKEELYAENPHLLEAVINSGGNPNGGKMKSAGAELDGILKERYAEIDRLLEDKISDIDKRYAGYADEISEYRRNGTAKESLGVIADVLIKNAAKKDDYDFGDLPWMSKDNSDKEDSDDSDEEKKKVTEASVRKALSDDSDGNGDTAKEKSDGEIAESEGLKDSGIYGELAENVVKALAKGTSVGNDKLLDVIGKIVAESGDNSSGTAEVLRKIARILAMIDANSEGKG